MDTIIQQSKEAINISTDLLQLLIKTQEIHNISSKNVNNFDEDNNSTNNVINLISILTKLSMTSKYVYTKYQDRQNDVIKCMSDMKALIKSQKKHINNLESKVTLLLNSVNINQNNNNSLCKVDKIINTDLTYVTKDSINNKSCKNCVEIIKINKQLKSQLQSSQHKINRLTTQVIRCNCLMKGQEVLIENLEASLQVFQKNKEINSVDVMKRNKQNNHHYSNNGSNKQINTSYSSSSSSSSNKNNINHKNNVQNNTDKLYDRNIHDDDDDDDVNYEADLKQELIRHQYQDQSIRGGKDDDDDNIDHPINFKRPPLSPYIDIYHEYDDDDDDNNDNQYYDNDDDENNNQDDDDHEHDQTDGEVDIKVVKEHDNGDDDDEEYKFDNYVNNENNYYINDNNNNNNIDANIYYHDNVIDNYTTNDNNDIMNIHDWNVVSQGGKQFIDDIHDDNVHSFYSINNHHHHHHQSTTNINIDDKPMKKSLIYDDYNRGEGEHGIHHHHLHLHHHDDDDEDDGHYEKVDVCRTTKVIGKNKGINKILEQHSLEVSDSNYISQGISNNNYNIYNIDDDDDDDDDDDNRINTSGSSSGRSHEIYHVWNNNTIDVGESFNLVKEFYEVHFDHNS